MTDAETTFWSAIVQIIPVILLAMVVEARSVRVNRRKLKRKAKELRAKHPRAGISQQLRFAWAFSWDRAYLLTSIMLATSLFLIVAEAAGLVWLYADAAPPIAMVLMALASIFVGLLTVALSPIFGRYVVALVESTPPLKTAGKPQEDRS